MMTDRLLGAHKSISGGPYTAFKRGEECGCTAMQIFTKNQSQWRAKPLDSEAIDKFHEEAERTGIHVIAHAAYLPNLASPVPGLHEKSFKAMVIEMRRCDELGIPNLVFHPGSHTTDTRQHGIDRVAESIDQLYKENDFDVALTIENTSGMGTNLGNSFEEIAEIIEKCGCREKIAVCFDTCHAFSAGYDIRTEENYKKVWQKFDDAIGMEMLAAIHLNDSKFDLGEGKDRHEHIGKGYIGLDGFRNIMNDKILIQIPMVLETPKGLKTRDGSDVDMDRENLKTLRSLIEEK